MITSRSNPKVKEIKSLRDRKNRDATGLFFAEGIRIVAEAVQVGAPIEQIVLAPHLLTSEFAQELVSGQASAGTPCLEVADDVFQSISAKENPQGLGAVIRQQWHTLDGIDPERDPWWVALSGVQDPGNLGSILRTSDAVGCCGAILLGATADPHDPSAVRASMGAIFSQRVVRTTLADLNTWKSASGHALIGTSDAATQDYQELTYPLRLVVLMGSEQHGLSAEERAACDEMVRIPMVGRSDSLNLSVATGVVLYEVLNQRRHQAARS